MILGSSVDSLFLENYDLCACFSLCVLCNLDRLFLLTSFLFTIFTIINWFCTHDVALTGDVAYRC
jgi:hypothetical protein